MIFRYNITVLVYIYPRFIYLFNACVLYAPQIVLSSRSSPLRKEGWKTLL